MFARRAADAAAVDVEALERVEALVRARFGLDDAALVLVSDDATDLAGGPPRATTVLFWTAADARHRVRVFRPAGEVTEADLPPRWCRGALLDLGDIDCC